MDNPPTLKVEKEPLPGTKILPEVSHRHENGKAEKDFIKSEVSKRQKNVDPETLDKSFPLALKRLQDAFAIRTAHVLYAAEHGHWNENHASELRELSLIARSLSGATGPDDLNQRPGESDADYRKRLKALG